ncbi:MAG: T9SS type A sorting domain-containing protein, partial [Crocinitomicaceae bacterium]
NYNHMHMFRGYLSAVWGDAINSTTMGATQIVSYQQTLPMDINGVALDIANLEIFAFINDGDQSAGDILTGVAIYPTLTGFTATDEVIFSSASAPDLADCDLSGSQTMSPTTTIQNWGSNAMTSATITYDVNGGTPIVMNWTGNIAPGATQIVTLDPISFVPNVGSNDLNVTVSNPNGVADNTSDNSGSTTFIASASASSETLVVTVELTTDRYASETTWTIKDGVGATIASGGPWADLAANGTTVQAPVNATIVVNDCYTFEILDSYGDGIDGGYGVGSFNVKDGNGNSLVAGGNFLSSDAGLFNANGDASINEVIFEEVSIFPNPASEVLNVNFSTEANDFVVSILDLQGRVLASQAGSKNVTFPVADLASGSYLVTISTENSVHTENVVIN